MNWMPGFEAMGWGFLSAVSLPLGAVFGLWLRPKQKINSAFMAFGAGALLFALTIELFGHVPHHVHEHGFSALLAAGFGALFGGFLFDSLNQILNNRGAFLRSLSNAKRFISRLKVKRAEKMLEHLSRIEVLQKISPEDMARLMERVQRKSYKPGELFFEQGDDPVDMNFIASGEVEIILHDGTAEDKKIAILSSGETFGEIGVLTGEKRTADAKAISEVEVFRITKADCDVVMDSSPEFQLALRTLAQQRVKDLSDKKSSDARLDWLEKTMECLDESSRPTVSLEDLKKEGAAHTGTGAAFAIWMGLMIDGIPESLVIGMLSVSVTGMSMAFISGVFLANFPEAMSSAVTMRDGGMRIPKIFLLWSSITLVTALGAFLGAVAFPAEPVGNMFYLVLGIEGLAAGAMLTMIAETMLPEAFEQGGSIVGVSTLCGFLAALTVKVM